MPKRENNLDAELAAAVASLPQLDVTEMLRIHREAAAAPPVATTMPMPDFPRFGVARYQCPLGCGWHHDETLGTEPPGPLLLPANPSPQNINDAITSMAEVRANAYGRRVENEIANHFRDAHPDH